MRGDIKRMTFVAYQNVSPSVKTASLFMVIVIFSHQTWLKSQHCVASFYNMQMPFHIKSGVARYFIPQARGAGTFINLTTTDDLWVEKEGRFFPWPWTLSGKVEHWGALIRPEGPIYDRSMKKYGQETPVFCSSCYTSLQIKNLIQLKNMFARFMWSISKIIWWCF